MEQALNTSTSNVTEIEEDASLIKFVLFLLAGFYITSVNVFVIGVIYVTESLHTRVNMYITSLAATDLMIGILSFVSGAFFYEGVAEYFHDYIALCLSLFMIGYSAIFCSVLNTCVIALDRYVCIFYPFKYILYATDKGVKIVIVCTWVVSTLLGTSPIFFHGFYQTPHCYRSSVIPDFFHKYVSLTLFLTGCSVTAVVYGRIWCHSYSTLKTINAHRHTVIAMEQRIHRRATFRKRVQYTKLKAFMKTAKLFAGIFGGFLICWLPYFIALGIPNAFAVVNESYFVALGYLNSGINGFIYGYFDVDFRHASIRILCRKRRRSSGSQHYGLSTAKSSCASQSVTSSLYTWSTSNLTQSSANTAQTLLQQDEKAPAQNQHCSKSINNDSVSRSGEHVQSKSDEIVIENTSPFLAMASTSGDDPADPAATSLVMESGDSLPAMYSRSGHSIASSGESARPVRSFFDLNEN